MNQLPLSQAPGIDPALATTTQATPAPATETSPKFQELLERLQRLAKEQPPAEEVADPEGLQHALRTADDGFVAAMDLRKQLEEAFKKHLG